MEDLRTRETSRGDLSLSPARRLRATSVRGLAVAAALFALLGSAGCIGLSSSKPLAPGGSTNSLSVSVSPSTIAFGSVVVGTTNSQWVTLTNEGSVSETVTTVQHSGYGFIYAGLPTPFTIGPGLKISFTISFAPRSAGASSGSMSIGTSAATLTVSLSGTGVGAAPQLSPSTSNLTFGSVDVGTPSSLPVTLKNTGTDNVSISSVSASGTGFAASGGSGVTLAPNQSTTVTVTFDPKAAGSVTGKLSIASNATNAINVVLSGTGVAASSSKHSVALNWRSGSSTAVGYFVYRGTRSGGPYSKLVGSIDTVPSYTDGTVSNGQTYYYVVTSVDSSNVESAYSNQVSVTIPSD
jgi:Abnormal spindle-like microcephaly-assoc'd, ASPM-SPD-2-Hydin